MKKKLYYYLIAIITLVMIALVFFVYSCYPTLDRYNNRSQILLDSQNNILSYSLTNDDKLIFKTNIEDVDPLYIKMLIASEDQRFYSHIGFDPIAILRAFYSNILNFKKVSGASTIAMQVVRIQNPKPRTILNKIKEAIGATLLTLRLGREEILNIYLTCAPMGGNIHGVNAASLKWFGHSAKYLTPSESAYLVALPRAPEHIRSDKHQKNAFYYKNDVLRLAILQNVIKKDIATASMKEQLPNKLFNIKQKALGLANFLFKNSKKEFYTNIQSNLQDKLLNLGEKYHNQNSKSSTMSAIVIDDLEHKVIGYLPSASPQDSQLDLVRAIRSPGSTLKPFIYEMAFENEFLHPKSIIIDLSKLFGSWEPRNFTRTYKGKISAEDALVLSLNIPTLKIVEKLNPNLFFNEINKNKTRLLLGKNQSAQLAIALGGVGVNLYDLSFLYSALNNDGIYYENQLLKDENTTSYKLFDEKASRATLNILKNSPIPNNYSNLNVAYKTGTSHKFRDALAIGSYGRYTIGVWAGDPKNNVMAVKTGFEQAAPILFEIASMLNYEKLNKRHLDESGVLSKTVADNLKFFNEDKSINFDKHSIKFNFPKNNQIISPNIDGYLDIQFEGGIDPVNLYVNDKLSESNNSFKVEKSGFYNLTLLDSEGRSESVQVKIIVE